MISVSVSPTTPSNNVSQSLPTPSNNTQKSKQDQKVEEVANSTLYKTADHVVETLAHVTQEVMQVVEKKTFIPYVKDTAKELGNGFVDIACETAKCFAHGKLQDTGSDLQLGVGLARSLISLPYVCYKSVQSLIGLKDIAKLNIQLKVQEARLKQLEKDLASGAQSATDVDLNIPFQILETKRAISEIEGKISEKSAAIFSLTELPKGIIDLAHSAIQIASTVGTKLATLTQPVLLGLSTAACVLGTISGAITVAFGALDMTLGSIKSISAIREYRSLGNQIQALQKQREEAQTRYKAEPEKLKIINTLYDLKIADLEKARSIQKAEIVKNLIVIGSGILVVTAGALAIAGTFTGGVTALILLGVGVGVGLIGAGIKISTHIGGKIAEKKVQETAAGQKPDEKLNVIFNALQKDDPKGIKDTLQAEISLIAKEIHKEEDFSSDLLTGLLDAKAKPENFFLFMKELCPHIFEYTKIAE